MRKSCQIRHFVATRLTFLAMAGACLSSSSSQAQDVETEDMLCRDIGDIFCLLEEFSKTVEGSTSMAAKIGPSPRGIKSQLDKTVVELQKDRQETHLQPNTIGLPTEVSLYNLSPQSNVWFLLKLQWGPQKSEWFHLENPDPKGLWIELNQATPNGIWLKSSKAGDRPCELWGKDSGSSLRDAKNQNAPFVPICQKSLYLRNRIEGYRTTKEWVVEFLRANVWGGETITNIVKETVYKDSFLMSSDVVDAGGRTDKNEIQGTPLAARLAPAFRGKQIAVPELGIKVQGIKEENMELGRWYKTARQDGVFVSVIEPKAIDEEILNSHRDYVRDLDSIEMGAQAVLVAFDTTQFDLHFAVGTDHPAVGWSERVIPDVKDPLLKGPDGFDKLDPLTATGIIPPYISENVVGIFTGGFKRDHGAFRWGSLAKKSQGSHYGFMENGVVLSSIVPELATLIVYNDNRIEMKTWTEQDNFNLSSMRYVRQNGVPIIEQNELTRTPVPGKWVSNWTLGNWSGSQDKKFRTLRAGMCQTERNGHSFIIYGYFSSMTPTAMARVFQSLSCQYAMHLDMNALEHTYMSLYAKEKAKSNGPEHLIKGMKVLDERFKGTVPRYIGYPDNRDFFYFVDKKLVPTK